MSYIQSKLSLHVTFGRNNVATTVYQGQISKITSWKKITQTHPLQNSVGRVDRSDLNDIILSNISLLDARHSLLLL